MWQHNYEPISGSLGASALVAAIPIVVLFVMLGVLRKPAWMSALAALVSALLVSLTAYGMPASLALISTLYGAAYGLFPIAWIVFTSIMLYRLAVDTGKFEIIKDSVGGLTDDRRLQAMFIAFSFGAFIEGAAGFGAPVAVSGAMLAGLGFSPFYAAGIYNLVQPEPGAQLGARKVRHIAALSPDMIATANPGCILQIAASARGLGYDWPIFHPIELVDASIHGVDPRRLGT